MKKSCFLNIRIFFSCFLFWSVNLHEDTVSCSLHAHSILSVRTDENWPHMLVHVSGSQSATAVKRHERLFVFFNDYSLFLLLKSSLHRTGIVFASNLVIIIVITINLLLLHEIKINAYVLMKPSGDYKYIKKSSSHCQHPFVFRYFLLQQTGKRLFNFYLSNTV